MSKATRNRLPKVDATKRTPKHSEFVTGDHRNTPDTINQPIRMFSPIGVDPCSNKLSVVNAFRSYDLARGENGLLLPWVAKGQPPGAVWHCNPIWSDRLPWVEKAIEEWREHNAPGFLITRPDSTTKWGRLLYQNCTAFVDLSDRHEFLADGVAEGNDTVMTRLHYFGERLARLKSVFEGLGHFVTVRA